MNQVGTGNLWSMNTPERFWACHPVPRGEVWGEAILEALPEIGLSQPPNNLNELLLMTLGEAQFGSNHWDLSAARRFYYALKPFLPRGVIDILKRINAREPARNFSLRWPVEDRFVRFLWRIRDYVAMNCGREQVTYQSFWPGGKDYAFVLTHDVETERGQSLISRIVELEKSLGFHSSFNFVPESYPLDWKLIGELKEQGFEIGVHGLKHDGKLFRSHAEFSKRATRINDYLLEFGAVGFRAPLMHRNPVWMQELRIEYDLSFFDTDPYEPVPGGCMCIWPYFIGHFVELPYTLVQDCTISQVLKEKTPRIWLEKLEFIQRFHGMALLNSHPDYLRYPETWNLYVEFLQNIREHDNYWHALPREVARWWRERSQDEIACSENRFEMSPVS